MGFLDSLSGLLTGGTNEDQVGRADFNLGNIFLPGGMTGGKTMERTPGGFGGSPLNQADWQNLNSVWGQVREAANFSDINWDAHGGQKLTSEAQQFVGNNWGNIRRAANLGDINWNAGIVGAPAYAQPTPGAGASAAPGNAALGDLEPARAALAGVATDQAGQAGQNNQGNILQLLREQAMPQERSAFNRMNNNLFMRGRLGGEDSATGEAYRGFSRGLAEADTGRQIASYGLSDQLQTGALQRSLGAAGGATGLTQLSTLPFDMALKLASARSGTALGQAQVATPREGLLDMGSQFFGMFK